jgi:hypothetical protein
LFRRIIPAQSLQIGRTYWTSSIDACDPKEPKIRIGPDGKFGGDTPGVRPAWPAQFNHYSAF